MKGTLAMHLFIAMMQTENVDCRLLRYPELRLCRKRWLVVLCTARSARTKTVKRLGRKAWGQFAGEWRRRFLVAEYLCCVICTIHTYGIGSRTETFAIFAFQGWIIITRRRSSKTLRWDFRAAGLETAECYVATLRRNILVLNLKFS